MVLGVVKEKLVGIWGDVTRTKCLDTSQIQHSELKRCLGVVDLTSLGIGSTLGAGVYVITGQVARTQAGPAVVLSFLIAAVASLLAGLCYAEFSARVPKAGSAYVYSYVSVGEIWAFIIGWNMILENMIGAASVGKAWSQYFDTIFNDTVQHYIRDNIPRMTVPGLADYPDLFALGLLFICTIIVALGVRMSSVVSTVFTIINLIVILLIIGVGVFYVKTENWTVPGFMPFGFNGVMTGAATCFYAFVGFDTIATSGEEAKNPSRNIPLAIIITLVVCFVCYFGVSSVMTLMVPYSNLSETATLPKVFAQTHIYGAEYIIAIGGMCGLLASMMGSIFPLPRIVYSMASDGIIFRHLAKINFFTSTPLYATLITGFLAAILATLLELESLVEMMSIGTLMAYLVVAVSVLVLRYQPSNVGLSKQTVDGEVKQPEVQPTIPEEETTGLLRVGGKINLVKYVPSQETSVFRRLPQGDDESIGPDRPSDRRMSEEIRYKDIPAGSTYHRMDSQQSSNSMTSLFHTDGDEPSEKTRRVVIACVLVLSTFSIALGILLIYGTDFVASGTWWAIILILVFGGTIAATIYVIYRQPKNRMELIFKVPMVPILPASSVLIDIYLMLSLSTATWIRFGIWMGIVQFPSKADEEEGYSFSYRTRTPDRMQWSNRLRSSVRASIDPTSSGFLIYFGYGMRHSSERGGHQEVILYDVSDDQGIVNEVKK